MRDPASGWAACAEPDNQVLCPTRFSTVYISSPGHKKVRIEDIGNPADGCRWPPAIPLSRGPADANPGQGVGRLSGKVAEEQNSWQGRRCDTAEWRPSGPALVRRLSARLVPGTLGRPAATSGCFLSGRLAIDAYVAAEVGALGA
jgi:hypothetical protein